jgi:hypothetical protein
MAVYDLTSADATLAPLQPQLERFVARLSRAAPSEPVLSAAADAWGRYAALPRYRAEPSVCAVVVAWGRAGFPPEGIPVDPAASRVFNEAETLLKSASRRAGRRLRRLGVSARTARIMSRGFSDTAVVGHFEGIAFD